MEQNGNNSTNARLDQIEKTLKELKDALLGSEYNGGNGYIKKIHDLDTRVEKLEKAQQAQLWFFLGAGGIGGAGLVKLFEYIFHA